MKYPKSLKNYWITNKEGKRVQVKLLRRGAVFCWFETIEHGLLLGTGVRGGSVADAINQAHESFYPYHISERR